MRSSFAVLFFALVASPAAAAPTAAGPAAPARPILGAAIAAMGGEARLRAIHDVHLKTVGQWSSVEASERPEPPWNINYDQTEQWLDYQRGAWREDSQYLSLGSGTGTWQPFGMWVADGVSAFKLDGPLKPGSPVYLADAAEQLLYQPYRLVLAALDAKDLRSERDEQLAGQPVQILAFHHGALPIRLWLDARTHRLVAAEVTHGMPEDYFWRPRGDVHDRLVFSQWTLHPSGVWFARQYDLIRAGVPYHSFLISVIEPNVATPAVFAIPDDIRAAFKATPRGPTAVPAVGEQPIAELAPGVWFAAARWNMLVIAQPAGAVLVDAPVSDTYVARTLEEVQRRFGRPAQAVVLTDHIVPELSGVREAAAHGVAIRALDANRGFVESLLAAPFTLAPDAYARSGRKATVEGIAARTTFGDGATRLELIPLRGTLGERVLLVWLPAARVLWVANALGLDAEGRASPSRLAELEAAIAREHLDVDQVVGAQLPPTKWAGLRTKR